MKKPTRKDAKIDLDWGFKHAVKTVVSIADADKADNGGYDEGRLRARLMLVGASIVALAHAQVNNDVSRNKMIDAVTIITKDIVDDIRAEHIPKLTTDLLNDS